MNNLSRTENESAVLTGQFSPLSRTQVTNILCHLLTQAGYNSKLYSNYSFRIGVATTLMAAGLSPWLIKTMGWWNSDAYMTYICYPTNVLRTVPTLLARANAF